MTSRRDFLRLSSALVAVGAAGACAVSGATRVARPASKAQSDEVWRRGAGEPYVRGNTPMPGVSGLTGPNKKVRFPDPDKYRGTTKVHGMCQLCSTVCGITGHIKDGRILKVDGNKNDPNSRGRLCARGQAALNHQYHPERLLYPLRRVGKRGEGRWRRITWEEAYEELATRLRAVRASGKPEEFAFHQGRNRTPDATDRFLSAFGTPTLLNHRALCSSARRAAALTYLWETDWDLGDFENSKYILNFGCNPFEAHQGHVPAAQRIQRGRFENGAKFVTFDVRLSNTAGNSDEFYMPFPATDGAIALAMSQTILTEGLYDATFIEEWTNVTVAELKQHLATYTAEWAAQLSGIPAATIQRLAREFAAAAPRATTLCNRGSAAHINGWYNDRAIMLLNIVTGSMGKPGGLCWMYTGAHDPKRFPAPEGPPKPKAMSILADPPEFVLANTWNPMRVGEIVYHFLATGRAKLQCYMTYNLDSPLTWPEMDTTRNVLLDEDKIGFHVCINPFLNETATFADMVLPWTTFMERWDVDARGAYNLKAYLSLRQPMVKPLGEAKDIREIFAELARRIGDGMEQWYPDGTDVRAYIEKWIAPLPVAGSGHATPLARLSAEGAFEDPQEKPYYEPFLRPVAAKDLVGSTTDPATGIITKDGVGIGIVHRGKPVVGFKTPSRKLEVRTQFVSKLAKNEDVTALAALANSKAKNRPKHHQGHVYDIPEMPTYQQIEEHLTLAADELVMTSFKWNVHNHGRTANLKWLAEIVHSNPAWLHPDTAKHFGVQDGDFVVIKARRSKTVDTLMPKLGLGHGEISGELRLPVVVTRGVHPRVIAISNSLGHWAYTSVARAEAERPLGDEALGMDTQGMRDADWQRNMWWQDRSGGDPKRWVKNTGPGWAQNHVLPIMPDLVSGQQAFNDTVVRVRKA
jgi:thiosulfate reductase / polysulfide reductase chain A